ncbi:hypothetical protein OB69_04145 [Roseivirga seohaensis subsp. aquiponti]|uniref:AbiTii domain-containing protein n=1 Tax=Roseivirga seohaensis subsp. aquiponti TaxID=1566026 RepID=A0A0L8APL4_9BACT|nr:hypothetical protein [Roseivirga seohaensis]KOF04176.1 hypothetical protein OB69_04145 [Roseivirga seohaensis subsp. aquiponti]
MIKDIIESLTDDSLSLVGPLLKVKVLASRIKNRELLNWVSKELNGYNIKDEDLPTYRIAKASAIGDLRQGWNESIGVTLPIMIFGDKFAKALIQMRLYQGVKALEEIASGKFGDTMAKSYGADFCAFLTSQAAENGQNIIVANARTVCQISEVVQSLSSIRNHLLDLLLKLEDEFPSLEEEITSNEIDKSQVNQVIYKVMNTFNTSGDGNIINTGDKNTINAEVTVYKGEVDQLKSELRKINVPEEDIEEIEAIVLSEEPNLEEKTLGPKAIGWTQKMLGKAMNKTWDIATGVAAGLLTQALNGFYGI